MIVSHSYLQKRVIIISMPRQCLGLCFKMVNIQKIFFPLNLKFSFITEYPYGCNSILKVTRFTHYLTFICKYES